MNKPIPSYKIDSKLNADKVRKAGELADRILSRYGEPSMSLDELRAALDRQLQGVSLSELIKRA